MYGKRKVYTKRDNYLRLKVCLPIQLLPLVLQGELPVDDDVYLCGPGTDGQPDLLQPGTEGELTAGEPGGHRSHGDLLRLVPAGIFTR